MPKSGNTTNKLSKQQVAIAVREYIEKRRMKEQRHVRTIKIINARPETFTPMPQRFLRDVPFCCSKRAQPVRILPDGTKIEIVASSAGRPTDRDMLLVVVVPRGFFYGLDKKSLEEVAAGGALAEISIPTSELRWWHNGRIADLKTAAIRLSSYTINYVPTCGDPRTHRYFAEFSIKNGHLVALLDRDMAKRTLATPWNIDLVPFLGLRTGTGRALFLMLAPDHRRKYDLLELAGRLGLPVETATERRDSITDIITGFEDIAAACRLKILPRPAQAGRSSRNSIEIEWT